MINFQNRQFLEFEQPIKDLIDQIEETKKLAQKNPKLNLEPTLAELNIAIIDKRKEVTANITPWQRVQLSRHPDRPYTQVYINNIFSEFIELFGDRNFKDDKAIIGGLANIDGRTVMVLGHQKGVNTKSRQYRNFGMPNPEGYRKALRLMKLAEKFNKPIITFIDTPGAYPGLEAEERGQGEAIARNIFEMTHLKVPVIVVVIGEGASGGALGIGVGDKVLMLENTWYSVISPESCSSILWRSWDKKELAAEQLKLTAPDMKLANIIDEIVPEPLGGAQWDYEESANLLKSFLLKNLKELTQIDKELLIKKRIEKYCKMGFWQE